MNNLEERPKCPDAKVSWYNGMWICNLNGKLCLLESGEECPYYEEYLEELNKEEQNVET